MLRFSKQSGYHPPQSNSMKNELGANVFMGKSAVIPWPLADPESSQPQLIEQHSELESMENRLKTTVSRHT